MRIASAEQIRYHAPQWLVEPTGVKLNEDELTDLELGSALFTRNVKGWGEYNAIVRDHDGMCYLVDLLEE